MLSIRPYQRCTNSAVNSRMKPPRQISSIRVLVQRRLQHRLERGAILAERLAFDARASGCRCPPALSSPPASARLEITTTISAGKSVARRRLDQGGHVRSAPGNQDGDTALHGLTMRTEIEMTVIDHAMFARGRDHLAQQRDAFAAFGEDLGDLFDRVRP